MMAASEEFLLSVLSISPGTLRLLRIFRVLRILRLLKSFRGLRDLVMARLWQTHVA